MWLLMWTNYKLSKGATWVSALGALMRYGSIMWITAGIIPGFLVCLPLGIWFHFLAENMNNKKWRKMIISKGYTQKIAAGDMETAIAVYKANPTESTLQFISEYNSQLAQEIKNQTNK